jgi:hypothetical protein
MMAGREQPVTLDCQVLPDPVPVDRPGPEAEREWRSPTKRWRTVVSRSEEAGEKTVRLPVAVQFTQTANAYGSNIVAKDVPWW